jgi:uncharacterized sulfatase
MFRALNRREFLVAGGAAGGKLLADWLPAQAGTPAPNPKDRPNVVMIVGDDQGWPDFGFMGHKVIRTPRLDALAKEGAVFPHGYTPCSLCRASLATILTGLYAFQHHICCNNPPQGVDRTRMHPFMQQAPALPRLLSKNGGYRSLQTGKFWEGHFSNAGFTHGQTTNADRHIATKVPQIGRATMQPIYDFIDQFRGKHPFLVWYAPMMPHRPHNPPERLLKNYRNNHDIHLARYYAMCEWFDETCGQLLDFLNNRHLTNNTLVVFVIDNGWVQPTTNSPQQEHQSPFGAARGKRSPYDGGVRSPVILRWPGHTRAGRHNDLVSTIDLAPTILRACGQQPHNTMRGLNLLDVAAGKGNLNRNAVFGEIYTHDCTVLGQPRMDVVWRWVRNGDWKLIVPTDNKQPVELYNLAQDPHERTNLAAKNADRIKPLRQQLDNWWNQKD